MSKLYGPYTYAQLKPQEYRALFRAGRRAHDKDADAKILPAPGTKGSAIEARLVAVDGRGRFVFETRAGKRIPVAADQLDLESRQRAKEVVNGQ